MGKNVLPEHLKHRLHDDWPGFTLRFQWREKLYSIPIGFNAIPRAWTSFDFGPPVLWKGWKVELVDWVVHLRSSDYPWLVYVENWKCPKPINPPGGWQISYFPLAPWWAKPIAWYVARSFARAPDGKFRQVRFGARWDNVDKYVNWPTFPSGRRYSGDDSQWTNNWEEKPS